MFLFSFFHDSMDYGRHCGLIIIAIVMIIIITISGKISVKILGEEEEEDDDDNASLDHLEYSCQIPYIIR